MDEKKERLTALISLGTIEAQRRCGFFFFFSCFVCVSGGAVAAWLPGSND